MKPVTHEAAVNPYSGKGELYVLFAGHAQTAPGHHVGPQVLDYYLVHHVLSGRGIYRCRGRQYELGPGDSFFIFPGELESYTADESDPWQYRWIAFNGSKAGECLAGMNISPERPTRAAGNSRRTAILYHSVYRKLREGRPSCDLESAGYLRIVLSEYMQPDSHQDRRQKQMTETEKQVDKAVRWLSVQYAQPVSIESMARSLGYHRTHLSKIFKRHTGMSPMEFLLKIRMERARLLIRENRLTIQQIASSVGFSDPLYFSRKFKEWYGCSPTEYREQLLNTPFDGC